MSQLEFSRVYLVLAYVDADGGFLLCVYNAGPHEFYGRWGFFCEVWAGASRCFWRRWGACRCSLGALHLRHFAGVDINHRRRQ